MKKFFFAMTVLGLIGCQSVPSIEREQYDPTQHAQIRLIPTNALKMYYGLDNDRKTAYKPVYLNRAAFPKLQTITLGMNPTKNSEIAEYEKKMYQEWIVPANKEISLKPILTSTVQKPCYQDHKHRVICPVSTEYLCTDSMTEHFLKSIFGAPVKQDPTHYFMPQAGRQYEYVSDSCTVIVFDITEPNHIFVVK